MLLGRVDEILWHACEAQSVVWGSFTSCVNCSDSFWFVVFLRGMLITSSPVGFYRRQEDICGVYGRNLWPPNRGHELVLPLVSVSPYHLAAVDHLVKKNIPRSWFWVLVIVLIPRVCMYVACTITLSLGKLAGTWCFQRCCEIGSPQVGISLGLLLVEVVCS